MKTNLQFVLAAFEAAKTIYVCPMHPDVIADTPGSCPRCNMKLEPKADSYREDE